MIGADRRTIEELKELGAHVPAPAQVLELYQAAFDRFGADQLWSSRAVREPTVAHVLAAMSTLRRQGNLESYRLAKDVERLCRAAV